MNQKHKSPIDPMSDPESPEMRERLDKIEQRLKAARPQPPRLELAAIQRLADEASVEAIVERTASRKFRLPVSKRKRRIVGRMLVVAGSWVCGAAVGAIVMFVLMDRTAPETAVNDEVLRIERATSRSITGEPIADFSAEREPELLDDSPVVEKTARRDISASKLSMFRDPLRYTESPYLSDGPTLQVGMYLRGIREGSMWPLDRTVEKEREFLSDDARGHSETSTKSELDPEYGQPVSRRQLMQEFLGEPSGAVL